MARRATLLLVFGAALLLAAAEESSAQFEEATDAPYEEEEEYEETVGGEGILDLPMLREFTARIQRHVDAEGLLRARRWGNIVNGILLGVTGPVALAVSTFGMKLSNVVLSLYVTGFGGLLAGLELGIDPVAPWVAKHLSYLMTGNGRTGLLVFAGNLVWAFGRTGLVPALLTCANALFNANFNKILSFVQADDDNVVSMSGGSSLRTPPELEPEESGAAEEVDFGTLREQLEAARMGEEAAPTPAEAEQEAAASTVD